MTSLPQPEDIREISIKRFQILQDLQNFFLKRNYLPVETPVLSPELIPESSIEIFATRQIDTSGKGRDLFLVPSPEVWMKQILAAGSGSIFQISRSFRNSEQTGKRHNPEFTMLEWYGVDQNYLNNMAVTEELFQFLAQKDYCSQKDLFSHPMEIFTLEEAFCKWAGFSLEENITRELLFKQAEILGLPVHIKDTRESLFNQILVSHIEPSLPKDRPTILKDYPSFVRTLSRDIPGTPWCERWELYLGEEELANCFSEETDPQKLEDYYRQEMAEKNIVPHRVDWDFCKLFSGSAPSLSGVALGVDRLIMALLGKDRIQGVLLFPLV